MTTTDSNGRKHAPAGTNDGGQFATEAKAEPAVALMSLPTVEQWAAKELSDGVSKAAADLRALADTLDARAADIKRAAEKSTGRTPYMDQAYSIQREIRVAMNNTPLDRLASWAAEADVARALGQ